jgi:hypothetical protein
VQNESKAALDDAARDAAWGEIEVNERIRYSDWLGRPERVGADRRAPMIDT